MKHEDTSRQPLPSLTGGVGGGSVGAGGGSLKQRTAQGLIWGGFSNGMVQLLGALFGIWLARMLSPEDYGMMAALIIFSNIASVLQESGFTAALANKQEPTHEEYNAVFWFNILIGLVLYVILFLAAPLIADFYDDPILCPLGRFAFLSFVAASFGTAQRAYLFGHLMVKQTSIMQMASITISNVTGICLAYAGLAYWCLAAQSLIYVCSMTAFAWYFSPWRPTLPAMQEEMKNEEMKNEKYKLPGTYEELPAQKRKSHFSFFIHSFVIVLRPAWQMFGFSSKLLVNSLAFQLNNNAFGVLLKYFFGSHVTGIFSSARKWNDMGISTISGMVYGVAQPVLRESAHESSGAGLLTAFRKLLRFTCFVSFPCLLGLALIAEDFIVLLIGEKWRESALLLSLLCVYGAFAPIVTLYSNLVISRGRSTINMVIGLLNCALVWGGIIVLHALGFKLRAMVIYYVVLNVGWLVVWQACARKLIGLRYRHALLDITPFLLFSLGVMVACWWLTFSMQLGWLRMLLRIALAIALYAGSLWLARARILLESIDYLFKKKQP